MSTVYHGGRIFDGEQMVDGHAVLVEESRIARVAPAGEFDGFAGEVVDCDGATVMPGLIDCHVHLLFRGEPDPMSALDKLDAAHAVVRALENAAATLRGGTTSVRDCGGREYQEFAVRNACNEGRFLGPTIRAAGKMICMTGGHGNRMGRVADGVDEVVKAVREQVHAGSDLVKIMATGGVMTPGVNPEDAHYSAEMPFIFQNISTVADRYAYLPSLACSLFVSGIWYFFVFKNWMRKGIAFLCLTVLAVIGVLQTDKWRDSKSILTHSLKVNKKSYASAMALGEIAETEKKWTEAFFYYKKANGINPVDFNAWLKIIFYHKKFGTGDDVLASLYQERIDSGYKSSPLIFKLLINYYLDSKKNDAALKYFELFRRFFPESEYVGELQTSMPKNKNEP